MRDDLTLGVKRAIPDARGNWTPLSAYEGWAPKEPSRLANAHEEEAAVEDAIAEQRWMERCEGYAA